MPEQLNAWGNYDKVAISARAFANENQKEGSRVQYKRSSASLVGSNGRASNVEQHKRNSSSPPSGQISAWGNYDAVATSARSFSKGDYNEESFRKEYKKSSLPTESDGQGISDTQLKINTVPATVSNPIVEGQTKTKWDTYFEKYEEEDSSTPIGSVDVAVLPTIDRSVQDQIRSIFSIYFDGDGQRKEDASFSIIQKIGYFNATMPGSQDYLEKLLGQTLLKHILLFIELSLRGISQVYFQNNPLSGLLILIGLLIQSTRVAVYGLLALSFGNLTVYLLRFDMGLARSGLFGYNSVLIGLAIATFDSPLRHSGYRVGPAILAIAMAVLSSILLVALSKILHPYKSPPLTLPFDITTIMYLLATANMARVVTEPVEIPSLPDYATTEIIPTTASHFFLGALRGVGQIAFADNLIAVMFIFAGIIVSSRIAAISALMGSLLGAGVALASGVDPDVVSTGVYGYCAALSVTALFTFYAPSTGAGVLALLAGVLTVIAQLALTTMLQPLGVPVMSLPFCLITLPFIILQGTTSIVIAIPLPQLTVPEDHLYRIHTLEEGIHFLKEGLHPEEQRNYSRRMKKTFNRINSAISNGENVKSMKNVGMKKEDQWVRDIAPTIFKAIQGQAGALRLSTFQQSLIDSGLTDKSGLRFASLVFHLLDLDGSNSIDEDEFVAFCLVSCAVATVRRKISQFVFFVDLNGNGWIDFDEINAALEYLGQPHLSEEEREALSKMTGVENGEEMELVELINLLTVTKITTMVATYQNSSCVNQTLESSNEL